MTARTAGILDNENFAVIPGIHVSPAEFDFLIAQHGNSGELRKAIVCPCVRIDTRTPDVSCPDCKGLGRAYPEHLRVPVIMLDTQRAASLKLTNAGVLADGTVTMTFPSDVIPGIGDMVLPDGEEHVVQELLFRDGTRRVTRDALRPHVVTPDQKMPSFKPRNERLLYPTQCCIESVAYKGEDGHTVFAADMEYQIDGDGRFTWKGKTGPAPGEAWSVRYRAPAAYIVHNMAPVHRSEADRRMPHRVQMRRLDVIAHQDLR